MRDCKEDRGTNRGGAAFTLVEVLVVLAIVATLVALLLPAVNATRAAARRYQCIANQEQLALAMLLYEQSRGYFPGYRNLQADHPDNGLTETGWVFSLLPYLERSDLAELYGPGGDREAEVPDQRLDMLVCPVDWLADSATPGKPIRTAMSYVVNAGMADAPLPLVKQSTASLPRDLATNGVCHDLFPVSHAITLGTDRKLVPKSKVSIVFLNRGDGTTSTLLLSENVDSGNWTDSTERLVGMVWHPRVEDSSDAERASAPTPPMGARINELLGESQTISVAPQGSHFARPSSLHPGGVVATFCDGHTQFLSEKISYRIYAQLMTPNSRGAKQIDHEDGTMHPVNLVFRLPLSSDEF